MVTMVKRCIKCGLLIADDTAQNCKGCGTKLPDEKKLFNRIEIIPKQTDVSKKQIEETRCTCNACGKVWFFGKIDHSRNQVKELYNMCKIGTAHTCPCCYPLNFFEGRNVVDLEKCPNCGSKAISKEQVIHEVEWNSPSFLYWIDSFSSESYFPPPE